MSATTVQSFYIAYYGRPADPSGLEYWVGRVEAEGGSFDSLVAAFGTSAEATELFSGLTDAQKINAVYQSTFGRDADAEGLAFYSAGLADGTFSVYDISKRILDGATTGDDAAIVANKITVAQAFTDELAADPELAAEYVGIAATTAAKAVVSSVTADAASVTAATASIAATFSITTSALTTSIDTIVGTEGRDRISGSVSNLNGTLQPTDQIDGGAGSDRATLTTSLNWGGFTTGFIKNVESVDLVNDGGTDLTFDASGISGATTLGVQSLGTGVISITNAASGLSGLSLNGVAASSAKSISLGYAVGAAEATGSSDDLTLSLTNVGGSTTNIATVTLTSIETANVVSAGSKNFANLATGVTKINVSGSGEFTTTVAPTGLTAFDASGASGKVTATLTGMATANTLASVIGGSGDDTFTLRTVDLAKNATITGGAGTNSVSLTVNDSGTVQYQMSGVQTLNIGAATAAQSISGGKSVDLITISTKGGTIGAATNTASAIDFVAMGARDLTFNALGSTEEGGDVTSDHSGLTIVNYKADSTAAKAGTSADLPLADYTFTETGSLTVNVEGYVDITTTSTLTAAKAGSLSLNVASGKNSAGSELTEFGGAVTVDKATSITVNASGKLDTPDIAAAAATSASITNGSTAGAIVLNTGASSKLASLTVSSGSTLGVHNDNNAMSALQTLTLSTSKGTLGLYTSTSGTTAADLVKIQTVNASGTGSDSKVVLGNLGSEDPAVSGYSMNISATGLRGGLEIGTVQVAPGYDVTAALTGTVGNITIGTLNATSAGRNVTITAPDSGKDVRVATGGVISATGDVSIDASGSKSAYIGHDATTAQSISGNNVSIDVSGSTARSYVGTVNAKSSATLVLDELNANTQIINTTTGATAFSAAVTGGVGVDTITVNATTSTVTAVTLTGDLDAGTDVVTVNTAANSTAKSINLSGLLNYNAATIYGGAGNDVIVGGGDTDVILGGAGTNTLTGNGGGDVFYFNLGDSTHLSVNRITDFKKSEGDTIAIGFGSDALPTAIGETAASTANAAGGVVQANSNNVALFSGTATAYDTLKEKMDLIDIGLAHTGVGNYVFFQHGGETYMFINATSGTAEADLAQNIAIVFTGVALPTADDSVGASTITGYTTGLAGFGG